MNRSELQFREKNIFGTIKSFNPIGVSVSQSVFYIALIDFIRAFYRTTTKTLLIRDNSIKIFQ